MRKDTQSSTGSRRAPRATKIRRSWGPLLSLGAAILWSGPAAAENPVVQHMYTADPAPLVHDGTLYLYTSHDEDVTVGGFFTMNDWWLFTSRDAANWTDRGSPLSYESFSWATGKAWAPHCVERNGKFYLYVPVSNSIGVAVADDPWGPFEDALGEPLLSNHQYIDPTVFVDDDGQAYLYFGNPRLWYVALNDDMISFSGSVQQIANTTASFGSRPGDAERPTTYEEGPWFYRRNDRYYLLFAAGPLPEDISYATASGPTGPWLFGGTIMESTSGLAFTNHAGVVDFKGHSLFFYHTQGLPGGGGYKRSVAVEEFTYGADGSIPSIVPTSGGVAPVENASPFERVEAETMAWSQGVEVDGIGATERWLAYLDAGDFVKVRGLDFRTGAVSFSASVSSAGSGGSIHLRLDAQDGLDLGVCDVTPTGGWQTWQEISCEVAPETSAGIHDLYLVFEGQAGSLFNVDWWRFEPKDPLPSGTGGAPSTGSGGAATGEPSPGDGDAPGSAGAPTADGSEGEGPSGCACSSSGPLGLRSFGAPPALAGVLFLALLRRRGASRPRLHD